jgi:hypothetical protein
MALNKIVKDAILAYYIIVPFTADEHDPEHEYEHWSIPQQSPFYEPPTPPTYIVYMNNPINKLLCAINPPIIEGTIDVKFKNTMSILSFNIIKG